MLAASDNVHILIHIEVASLTESIPETSKVLLIQFIIWKPFERNKHLVNNIMGVYYI